MTRDDFLAKFQEQYDAIDLLRPLVISPTGFAELLVIAGVLEPEPTQQDEEEGG